MGESGEESKLLGGPSNEQSSRKPARCYYFMLILVFFILFIDCVVSLGSFGVIQYKVNNFYKKDPLHPNVTFNTCILFGKFSRDLENGIHVVKLTNIGSCAFVLWGLISIMIVAFVWLVFSIVLVFIGKVFSVVRILDFFVLLLTFLLSFSLSVTITAGINATCSSAKIQTKFCQYSYLTHIFNPNAKLHYYEPVRASQNSSWVATFLLMGLAIWKFIAVIVFVKKWRKRRRERPITTRFHDETESPSSDSDSSSASELEDTPEEPKKSRNPFTLT